VTARKAMYAVYAVFILNGFMFATWASRIPQVRDGLELNPQRLGLVLLAIAIGSLISMPLAGLVISRLGAARTVSVMSLIGASGLAIAAVATSTAWRRSSPACSCSASEAAHGTSR
jgi:fucose permease